MGRPWADRIAAGPIIHWLNGDRQQFRWLWVGLGGFVIPSGPMARMTKADIIEAVYEKVGGFSKKEAAEIVETVFNVVKETLERGEKIKISGFGNFVVRDKKDRMGRDPQRAVPILIPARRVLTFKPSQVLKNILNGLPPV
jgi:integration host factor subunit alpha